MSPPRNHPQYETRYWESADGLKLAYRDYAGGADGRPPILCISGLTRNARDFEGVAARLAGAWRVIAVDLRGRGKSEYAKDPMTYLPPVYAADVVALLDSLEIPSAIFLGTSLGGIVTMLIAAQTPDRIAGAALNDVGPELDPVGMSRIRGYVGKANNWPTWMHAARSLIEGQGNSYPDYGIEDWLAMAKRLYRLNSAGRIVMDYDMRIAEPFKVPGNEAAPDMWGAYDALAAKPLLIVRGQLSDILTAKVAARMAKRGSETQLVTVPRVGHTPILTERPAAKALDALLAKIAKEPVAA